MILDRLENASSYATLGGRIAQALLAMGSDFVERPDGRYQIDGDHLVAIVQSYVPKPASEGRFEAHRRYIDLQYLVSGSELMRVAPVRLLVERQAYDADSDVIFFDSPAERAGADLWVEAGMFAIFFPHDGHMPSLYDGRSDYVKKVVFKIEA